MENLDFLILYIITVFVASIIPGPSMLLALAHGIKLSSFFIKNLFNKSSLSKYFSKIVGTTFIGLGASLALTKNRI